ncbi:MAG TPA: arsenite methyltransferase [Anaerolineales bacterium]|nr:arsenite methyltransferase [Anaerolineales bacterium]
MSMTAASYEYFNKVAGEWDAIRSGYFSEAVREAAIRKAYLRPEMIVGDIGAGTGYVSAGLAPLVRQVYVLDGSQAMLEVARQNLHEFDNVIFETADGSSLPLPDASLDAVFANMYLHHLPEPLAGIREAARLLKPGGRLVITEMDAHSYGWLKEEMADVWQGFDREQMRNWYEAAGLVNIIIESTGQSCSATSEKTSITDAEGRSADISVFVAAGTKRVSGALQAVRESYGAAALNSSGCCSPESSSQSSSACCGGSAMDVIPLSSLEVSFNPNYSLHETKSVPSEAASLALGCGNPTGMAGVQAGETVLDIGSGAGMDAFLAARQVGPAGKVIGVDMTPAMLERARRGAAKSGLTQVEFRQGQAEALPVEDNSVDVIISNCVINLTEDKGLVFREAYRVLKPGGRLEVSDMVTDTSIPAELRSDPNNWSGCVFGALPEQEYLDLVAQAGFQEIRTQQSLSYGENESVTLYSLAVSARKLPLPG